jgi:hypothetical protein
MADLVGMVLGLWSEVAGRLGNFPARPTKMAAAVVPRRGKPRLMKWAGMARKAQYLFCSLPCTNPRQAVALAPSIQVPSSLANVSETTHSSICF